MAMPLKIRNSSASGFTLIEVMIGVSLFIAVVVPLMAGLYLNTGIERSEDALVGAWLLEQEAASVRLFSDEGLSGRHRIVNGNDWTVEVQAEGTPLVKYTLTALKHGKKKEEVVVYGIKKQ
jgi:type II secretory pathway pseudopilin PulG